MTGIAGFDNGNMCGVDAYGKHVVMTLGTLSRQFFKYATNMAVFTIQQTMITVQGKPGNGVIKFCNI